MVEAKNEPRMGTCMHMHAPLSSPPCMHIYINIRQLHLIIPLLSTPIYKFRTSYTYNLSFKSSTTWLDPANTHPRRRQPLLIHNQQAQK